MPKRARGWIVLVLCVLLCTGFAAGAADYVNDQARLLTDEQAAALEAQAGTLAQEYACGIYIATVEEFAKEAYTSLYEFGKQYYESNQLGWGQTRDGVLLVLGMAERDYTYLSYGTYANTVFSDAAKSVIEQEMLPYFAEDDWYGGLQTYLTCSENLLLSAKQGNYIEKEGRAEETGTGTTILWSVLIGFGIAGVIGAGMVRSMNNARACTRADGYIAAGGLHLTGQRDLYRHTQVVRRPIQTSPDTVKDNSGHHSSQSGFSGKSGKF